MNAISAMNVAANIARNILSEELDEAPERYGDVWEPLILTQKESAEILKQHGPSGLAAAIQVKIDEALFKLQDGLGRPASDYPVWADGPVPCSHTGLLGQAFWLFAEGP